jgi:hypothetical protein
MIGELIGINYDIAINYGDIIVASLFGVAGYFLFGLRIYDDRLFVKERDVIKTCRQKGDPMVLKVHPGTGEAYAEIGKKKDKDDILYESRQFGASIDASFSGMGEPVRLPKGLNVHLYSTSHPYPVSIREIIARPQMINEARRIAPSLKFLTDKELCAAISTDRADMQHNFKTYIQKYMPLLNDGLPMSPDEMIDAVVNLQDVFSKRTPNYEGPCFILAAIKNIPGAFFSTDLQQLETIIWRMAYKKVGDDKMKWLIVGAIAFSIVIFSVAGVFMFMGK